MYICQIGRTLVTYFVIINETNVVIAVSLFSVCVRENKIEGMDKSCFVNA